MFNQNSQHSQSLNMVFVNIVNCETPQHSAGIQSRLLKVSNLDCKIVHRINIFLVFKNIKLFFFIEELIFKIFVNQTSFNYV